MSKVKKSDTILKFRYGSVIGAVYLDYRKPKKNGHFPIFYKITFQTERRYYNSGCDADLIEWDELKEVPSYEGKLSKVKRLIKEKYDYLESGFEIYKKVIEEIKDIFSFNLLNKKLGKGIDNNVFLVYDLRIQALRKEGKISTSDWYYYSVRSLYLYKTGKLLKLDRKSEHTSIWHNIDTPQMKFTDITIDWLKKYEKWLIENGKSYTSISMFLRAFQAIVNEGIAQGHLTKAQYPFGSKKYEIPIGEGRNMALTLAQIGEVIRYELRTDVQKRCRDLWLFSYLCNGINICDVLNLKYSDINNSEISFYRKKTISKTKNKKKIVATMLPQMQKIIETWGNKDKSKDNFIFPFLYHSITPVEEMRITKNQTKQINNIMGAISEALKMPKISTYTARHSYATVLKRSGANIAFISESLGHTDIDTTKNYLDTFEKDERIKNANLLTQY